MTALDTSVLVRLIVRDDPAQVTRAAALIRENACWAPTTVLLEAEWVLGAVSGYSPEQVVEAFGRLVSMENMELESGSAARLALDRHGLGLDSADVLHLAASHDRDRFATFDVALRRAATRFGRWPPVMDPRHRPRGASRIVLLPSAATARLRPEAPGSCAPRPRPWLPSLPFNSS